MSKMFKLFLKFTIFSIIAGFIASIYMLFYFSRDLPDYNQLANYQPKATTRFYSADGKLLEEYAKEHRIFVPINSIPNSLIEAFIAAEDKNFYQHLGVDIISLIRAVVINAHNLIKNRRMTGGSTITQQVVKNFLLSSERSVIRKIKEAILSYRISKVYTKSKIMELYLNQIYLGKGAHGVGSAALKYFNKSVEELDIAESAFLAGLPKAPSTYDPRRNYTRAIARRNYVITRMVEDNYITPEAAQYAMKLPLKLKRYEKKYLTNAPYFATDVQTEIIEKLGVEALHTGGLTVITTLNSKLQHIANNAMRKRIHEFDYQTGYRGPLTKISIENWLDNLREIPDPEAIDNLKLAVILDIEKNKLLIGTKDGKNGKITEENYKWIKQKTPNAKLGVGDVIAVEQLAKNNYKLQQIPEINGGLVIMEPTDGRVLAMVGGYSFTFSKFNRASQALRQTGSVFKPLVYLAALENGIAPNTLFEDAPIEVIQGPGLPLWSPKNYEGQFQGWMPMRIGLEKSRNIITIKVAQAIGLEKLVEITKRFGIHPNPPKIYSLALGTLETSLINMTNAYAMMINGGKKIKPELIEMIKDRSGKVIYRRDKRTCANCNVILNNSTEVQKIDLPEINYIKPQYVTDPASSYQITSLLLGAAKNGTSRRVSILGKDKIIGGKTGTTNDSKDAWFIGFINDLVVGSYIGYDAPRSLGKYANGATTALPLFIDVMSNILPNHPTLPFKIPEGISLRKINRMTGKKALDNSEDTIMEAFKIGTEPQEENNLPQIYDPEQQYPKETLEIY